MSIANANIDDREHNLLPLQEQPLGTPAHEWAKSTQKAIVDQQTLPTSQGEIPPTESTSTTTAPTTTAPLGSHSVATTPGYEVPGAWVGPRPDPVASANVASRDVGSTISNLGQQAANYFPQSVIGAFKPADRVTVAQSTAPPITTTTNHPSAAGPPGTAPPQPLEQPGYVQQAKDTLSNAASGAQNMAINAIYNVAPSTASPPVATTTNHPSLAGPPGTEPPRPAPGPGLLQQTKDTLGNLAAGAQDAGANAVNTVTPSAAKEDTRPPASGPPGHPAHPGDLTAGPTIAQQVKNAWGNLVGSTTNAPGPVDPQLSATAPIEHDNHRHGGVGNLPGATSETDVVRLPEERAHHDHSTHLDHSNDRAASKELNAEPPQSHNENFLATPLGDNAKASNTGVDTDVQEALANKSGSQTDVVDQRRDNGGITDSHRRAEEAAATIGAGGVLASMSRKEDALDSDRDHRADDNNKTSVPLKERGAEVLHQARDKLRETEGHGENRTPPWKGEHEDMSKEDKPHHQGLVEKTEQTLHIHPSHETHGHGVDNLMGRHGTKGEKEPDSHFYEESSADKPAHLDIPGKTSAGAAAAGAHASDAPFHVHDHNAPSISSTLATKSTAGTATDKGVNVPSQPPPVAAAATPSSPKSKSTFGTFGRKSADAKRNGDEHHQDVSSHSRVSSNSAGEPPASPSGKVSFKDKLKGELKVISGKLTRDDAKVEEGKALKSGSAAVGSPNSPTRALTR